MTKKRTKKVSNKKDVNERGCGTALRRRGIISEDIEKRRRIERGSKGEGCQGSRL